MIYRKAEKCQSNAIARLIMLAMNYDCCQYFAGERHSLHDFEELMTSLVEADDSQYSYKNCIVAVDNDGVVAGVCVSYDGANLLQLRSAFVKAAKEKFNRDFSGMDEETSVGELYIDSLAVFPEFQHRGIATKLLNMTVEKAKTMKIGKVGLLVDAGNPNAERLYSALGYVIVGLASWGGHPMKHMQMDVD